MVTRQALTLERNRGYVWFALIRCRYMHGKWLVRLESSNVLVVRISPRDDSGYSGSIWGRDDL